MNVVLRYLTQENLPQGLEKMSEKKNQRHMLNLGTPTGWYSKQNGTNNLKSFTIIIAILPKDFIGFKVMNDESYYTTENYS